MTKIEKINAILDVPYMKDVFDSQLQAVQDIQMDRLKARPWDSTMQKLFTDVEIAEMEKELEEFNEMVSFEKFKHILVRIYDEHLDEEEVNLFYTLCDHPIYKRVQSKMPALMAAVTLETSEFASKALLKA